MALPVSPYVYTTKIETHTQSPPESELMVRRRRGWNASSMHNNLLFGFLSICFFWCKNEKVVSVGMHIKYTYLGVRSLVDGCVSATAHICWCVTVEEGKWEVELLG